MLLIVGLYFNLRTDLLFNLVFTIECCNQFGV